MDIKVFTEDGALELAEKLLQNDKDIKEELEQKGYATESFVTEKIAQAQLSGGEVDLSGYVSKEDLDGYAKTEDIPTSLPASDVYDWAKAETKPEYTADEVGALPSDTEIPSIEGLVSEERLTEALSPYAKTTDIPDEYDDTALSNRVTTVENDYLKSSDKTELTQAIATAKTETIETILGEAVDADFDTLQEVADWIQADTTASAELVVRVTDAESDIASIQNDYLKAVDKTELLSSISTNTTAISKNTTDITKNTTAIEENAEAIADNTTAIAVERARIDAFTALTEGSTTGDAELIDGRTKADGSTATNIGNAIREQYNTLDDKIDESVRQLSSEITGDKYTYAEPNNQLAELYLGRAISESNGSRYDSNMMFTTTYGYDDTVLEVSVPSDTYYFNVLAFGNITGTSSSYIGVWNGTEFVKTADGKKWFEKVNLEYFRNLFPSYYFRIQVRRKDEEPYTSDEFSNILHVVRKYALASEVEDIKTNMTIDGLPSYYNDYVTTKISEIRKVIGENSLSKSMFYFISDQHYPSNADNAYKIMREINKACKVDMCVNCGDFIVEQVGEKDKALNYALQANKGLSEVNDVYLSLVGNHDDNANAGHTNDNRTLSGAIRNAEYYQYLYKGIGEKNDVVFGDTGKYYYYDDTFKKVRYIVLDNSDTDEYEEISGTNFVKSKKYDMSAIQINWLINKALNVGNDWSVLVFTHIPLCNNAVGSALATTWDLLRGVLNAFKNHGTGGWTKDGIDCTCDFTQSTAEFIGALCGHIHTDEIFTSENYTCMSITADTLSYGDIQREVGTVNEHAFDVVIVDTETKTVNTIRIGEGANRSYSY